MKGLSVFLLATAAAAASPSAPAGKTSAQKASATSKATTVSKAASSATPGTWTFYSTFTDEVTSSSTSKYGPVTETSYVVVPTTTTITKSTGLTIHPGTKTITATKRFGGRVHYVDPAPGASTAPIVTVTTTPSGFTPIASEFAYTASVKVSKVTVTTTYVETEYEASTVSVTSTYTAVPDTVTKTVYTTTVSVPTTRTLTKTTTIVTPVTTTRSTFPTHHAICNEDSGNYVNRYPYGVPFEALAYSSQENDDYGSVHALDRSGVYFNETFALATKVDCCNYAMTNLAAFGYWQPQGDNGPNSCLIFNVRDEAHCKGSEVKYSLVPVDNINPDSTPSAYFAL
jgi:hypothetical protein